MRQRHSKKNNQTRKRMDVFPFSGSQMEVTKLEHLLSFPKEKKMVNIINTGASSNRKKRDSVRLHRLQNSKKQIFFFIFTLSIRTPSDTVYRQSHALLPCLNSFKPISFDPMLMVVVVLLQQNKALILLPSIE